MAEAQTQTAKEMAEDDAGDIRAWMDGLAGDAPIRVLILRKRPEEFNGRRVGGSLETVEERIDEEYVSDVWGGGTFQLKVSVPTPQGGWKYFRARTIKIAGDPKMHGQEVLPTGIGSASAAAEQDNLASQAFRTMERTMTSAQERAERLEEEYRSNIHHKGNGFDLQAVAALNEPLMRQLDNAQQLVRDLQQRMVDQATRRPDTDPFRDRLLEKMVDGESQRVETLRTQFESELRQIREHHRHELDQAREAHREDTKSQEKRHDREIEMMRNSYEAQVRSNEVAYGTRTDALKSEVDRLHRELTESRSELAALRAKKDQSLPEKAEELLKVKDALSGLSPDSSSDESDKPWYERLLSVAGNSEAALALIEKITGGGGGGEQPQAVPQMLPPVGVPFQGPDGQVYVRQPDNSVVRVDVAAMQQRRRAAKRRKPQAVAAAPGAAATELGELGGDEEGDEEPLELQQPPPRPPDAKEVSLAIRFMESALSNGTDPAAFAQTARSMIPADILRYIAAVGVDEFLNGVARLEPGSPLTTQNGRNFARAVGKVLLEGVPT